MKKILFISHELSHSGAPKVLFDLLKKINKSIEFDVLALSAGTLTKLYKHNFSTIVNDKGFSRLLFYVYIHLKSYFINYDLIFINSVSCFVKYKKIKHLLRRYKNTVLYVHESEILINILEPKFKNYTQLISNYVCVSEPVKSVLMSRYGIPENKITVIPPIFSENLIINDTEQNKSKKLFTVCSSGTAHFIKGYDIFLQIARYVLKKSKRQDIQFIWVGKISPEIKIFIDNELTKFNLHDKVIFSGHIDNPIKTYQTMDLALITSREESFSLYAYESGMLGKPVLCFDQTGGVAELVKLGGELPIEYMNVEKMGDAILDYYYHQDKLKISGDSFKQNFSQISPSLNLKNMHDVIENGLIKAI